MPRAERRERAGPHVGELGGADDRDRQAGPCVVERQQTCVGRQSDRVVVQVIADDLDAGKGLPREVAAKDVEVPPERGIGLQVNPRLDPRGARPLRAEAALDGREDLSVAERERLHVGLAEEDKLARLHRPSRAQGLRIDGLGLTADDVARVARDGDHVEVDRVALTRMTAARAVVEHYLEAGLPAYGLTTNLGARVVEPLPADALETFSRLTVLGRAQSVGSPLPPEDVRAAMLVRICGLARGGAGARPDVAETMAALLNGRVHPVVPSLGSIGAGDICMLAHIGLVLIGEGRAELDGEVMPGAEALAAVGLEPLALAPKDGLAVISSNAVSIAWAALALGDSRAMLDAVQASAALSLEAFRANLSPLDERVARARPAPGQSECAAALRALLRGGSLAASGGRRLQDPLSFRCVSQVHGSLLTACELLAAALVPELQGAADNPLVLADDGEIVSTGNFFVPALALAADMVALALAQVSSLCSARIARLLSA